MDFMIQIDQLCAKKKNDMFYIEPSLENLKVALEQELAKMPRKSVASPTEMFTLVIQGKPRVLRIHRNTKKDSDVWCTVGIVNEED